MKPRAPMYSPELVGINNRQVMERELLKIQEVFDQYARLMVQFSNEITNIDSSNPEGAARTTRDLLLINPQRSGFTTQEDANKEFARRIDALEASGGGGSGDCEQTNIDGGNASSVYQFEQHIDGGLA